MARDITEECASVLTFSAAEVNRAVQGAAGLPAGPAKNFLGEIGQFASGDYDPRDVIVMVIRPPGRHE